jgi:hypothetical protein
MIKTEAMTIGTAAFIRTYSDAGRYVVREGVAYEEAIDPAEFGRTYTEGEPIEDNATADELLDILTGEAK